VRRPLDFCIWFSLFIDAFTAFFLHPHVLALAVLRTLNFDSHVRNLLIDARGDALDASGLGERHTRAMFREMCRMPRGAFQATAGHHDRDGASLD
jgi:hypothetical protein